MTLFTGGFWAFDMRETTGRRPKTPPQNLQSVGFPLELRSYVPHTKYKIPPNPKIHPEIHPKSPSKTEIQKKYEKNTKLGDFRIFFVFFLYFGFGGGFGVYFGVYFGVRRGFVFCMGHV